MKKSITSGFSILALSLMLFGCSSSGQSKASVSSSKPKTEKVTQHKNKKLKLTVSKNTEDLELTGTGGKQEKVDFNLKGKINRKANITISGQPSDNIWGGKNIKKTVKKGNFNIKLPIYADEKAKNISLKIEAKTSDNHHEIEYVDLKNSTQAYTKYKESVRAASSKAESESKAKESSVAASESQSMVESQSRASSESTAASIAESQSEAATASSKVAASQSRSNANAAKSSQNSGNNVNGGKVATGGSQIVGDINTGKYHMPGQATYYINSENAIFFQSEQEAINKGYVKSKR